MNKYQVALDYIKHDLEYNDFIRYKNDNHVDKYHREILRELVDKATPMKPTNQYLIDFGLGNYGKCKRCKNGVNYQQKYCGDCGQKLDWSYEE